MTQQDIFQVIGQLYAQLVVTQKTLAERERQLGELAAKLATQGITQTREVKDADITAPRGDTDPSDNRRLRPD